MEFLQELFMAVVFSVIVAALIAFSGSNEKGVSVTVIKIGDEKKKMKVVGGKTKSKKKVKFMDEFVVKDVEDEERLNLDLNFLDNFDGILENSLEEAISRDEQKWKAVSEVPESQVFSGSEMKRNGMDSITELNMADDVKEGAVEVMNQSTDKGVKETEISAFDGGLENSRNRALGGMSYENEEDGALCEESNAVGVAMKEDLGESCTTGGGDDWEGIEWSELEKVFAKAVNYVEYGGKDELTNMGSNVQTELYGFHKLAIEGPCYEPQPMALKVYARARWNSWQKLGSMSPELAMEQYIKLVSETHPKWASYHPDAIDGKDGLMPSGAAVELMANDDEGRRSQDI